MSDISAFLQANRRNRDERVPSTGAAATAFVAACANDSLLLFSSKLELFWKKSYAHQSVDQECAR
jgi:hypothetical protein